GEIDSEFLFDLPQLPEDDLNFIALTDMRYNYYLDKGDFENAKKSADRVYSIIEDMPKIYRTSVCINELYNACTFDFNEELADDLMYDYDKYLNSYNNATNLRIKLAYALYVKKEKAYVRELFDLGIKRSGKMPIKGQGLFEEKLLRRMESDVLSASSERQNDSEE
ncbi:MAG: hypothetical protein SPL13_01110, partial [Clostridia bacterium]|nr:hypothetical protein [Clostridia bacterium]